MDETDCRAERFERISEEVLAAVPGAVVFGSAARGEFPNDLDVFATLSPYTKEAGKLLAIARKHYGWLDVFIRPPEGGRLLVRNDLATGWMVARNARGIGSAIERDGIPLAQLSLRRRGGADGPPAPEAPSA